MNADRPAMPSAHYRDARGRKYHASQQSIRPWIKSEIDGPKFAAWLEPPVGRLVDFGCGEGWMIRYLEPAAGIGVDAILENRQHAAHLGIDVRESLSEIETDWANVVISHHALEHTLDPYRTLVEMRRVLRPDGRLLLYVPADDWRVNGIYDRDDRNHHLFTWTPLALGHLLTEAGFDVQACRIEHRGMPGRFTERLYTNSWVRLDNHRFKWVTTLSAYLLRRREIFALAT